MMGDLDLLIIGYKSNLHIRGMNVVIGDKRKVMVRRLMELVHQECHLNGGELKDNDDEEDDETIKSVSLVLVSKD